MPVSTNSCHSTIYRLKRRIYLAHSSGFIPPSTPRLLLARNTTLQENHSIQGTGLRGGGLSAARRAQASCPPPHVMCLQFAHARVDSVDISMAQDSADDARAAAASKRVNFSLADVNDLLSRLEVAHALHPTPPPPLPPPPHSLTTSCRSRATCSKCPFPTRARSA